jgi:Tol biopolymer transport system component
MSPRSPSGAHARAKGGRTWFVLAVLALVGCSNQRIDPPSVATTTTEPEDAIPGTIAYLGTDGNVFLMAPDGSGQRPLTSDAQPPHTTSAGFRYYEALAWAPGSNQLAFVGISGDEGGSQRSQILVADQQTEALTWFEHPEELPFYLYWSPDGQRLTFLASNARQADLSVWLIDGQGEASLLDRGQPYYWAWSADGRSLLAHAGGSAAASPVEARVTRFDEVPGDGRPLALRPLSFQAPAFAPEGQRALVAASVVGGDSGLLLLDPEGRPLERVAQVGRTVAFAWAPSGSWAAFVEQSHILDARFGELMLLDLTTAGSARLVPSGLESVAAFFWSPVDDRLLAIVPVLAPHEDNPLVSYARQGVAWRLRLYLIEPPQGQPVLLTEIEPTDDFLSLLPFYDQYQRSSRLWSPDGRWMVLPIVDQQGDRWIARLAIGETFELVRLVKGDLAFWSFE